MTKRGGLGVYSHQEFRKMSIGELSLETATSLDSRKNNFHWHM